MKIREALNTNKDKLLNFSIGAGIPAGTVISGSAGGCTGICGSCGASCLGGAALALWLCGRAYYKHKSLKAGQAKTAVRP